MAKNPWQAQQPASNLFGLLLLGLALACGRMAFAGGRTGAVVVAIVAAVLLAVTAIVFLKRAKGFRVLVGITGSLLILYSLSVVVLGSEDVGGSHVAIPLAVGLALFGAWGIILAVRGRRNEAA